MLYLRYFFNNESIISDINKMPSESVYVITMAFKDKWYEKKNLQYYYLDLHYYLLQEKNHILLDYSVSPTSMADTFKRMAEKKLITEANASNLAKAAAFRNIAVHQYDILDNKIILAIIKEHLHDFEDFAKAVNQL